jgi:hypothetical protein
MIRFLKIQENSGLANNDVDQTQMVSDFARRRAIALGTRRRGAAAEEFSGHRNLAAMKLHDSANDS